MKLNLQINCKNISNILWDVTKHNLKLCFFSNLDPASRNPNRLIIVYFSINVLNSMVGEHNWASL